MKDNEKKIDEQEKLLDHIIEYSGRQYIADEVKKYEEMPELELPDEFNDRMDKMFKDAYKKELKKERIQTGKKVAAISILVLGIASATAMNVRAFREPVLNFIFKMNGSKDKTKVSIKNGDESDFSFGYIPDGYKCTKERHLDEQSQIAYEYRNTSDEIIYIFLQLKQTYDTYQNVDKSSYTKIKQNNHFYYFLKGEKNKLLWYKNNIIFTISSVLSENEMMKIAEHISQN